MRIRQIGSSHRIGAITLLLFLQVLIYSETGIETFSFYGKYRGSSWSSDSSFFAVFWETMDGSLFLSVVDGKSALISDPILLNPLHDIRAFDWNADDSGFVLKVFSKGITETMHIDRKGRVLLLPGEDGFENVYPTGGLFINKDGFLALTISGEGHPDVYVYDNNEKIFSTDVYPGIIHCVGWKDGYLYCISDMDLSLGLHREDRRNQDADSPGKEQMYKIDIQKGMAQKSNLTLKELHFLSPDKTLIMNLNKDNTERFSFSLQKTPLGVSNIDFYGLPRS